MSGLLIVGWKVKNEMLKQSRIGKRKERLPAKAGKNFARYARPPQADPPTAENDATWHRVFALLPLVDDRAVDEDMGDVGQVFEGRTVVQDDVGVLAGFQ